MGGHKRIIRDVDVTGHYQGLPGNVSEALQETLTSAHYETAFRFVNFWQIEPAAVSDTNEINRQLAPPNTTCAIGQTKHIDKKGKWYVKINSKTHWGDIATRVGVRRYRAGKVASPNSV